MNALATKGKAIFPPYNETHGYVHLETSAMWLGTGPPPSRPAPPSSHIYLMRYEIGGQCIKFEPFLDLYRQPASKLK
jgi:hypothetical protein